MKKKRTVLVKLAGWQWQATDSYAHTITASVLIVLSICMMAWWSSSGTLHAAPVAQVSPLQSPTPEPGTAPMPGLDHPTGPGMAPTAIADPFSIQRSLPANAIDVEEATEEEPEEEPEEDESTEIPLLLNAPEMPDVDRPVVIAATGVETEPQTVMDFVTLIFISTTNAIAWIWLACGSLIFFVVAGIVAGIYFSHRKRERYQLYSLTPDESEQYEVVKEESVRQNKKEEDIWPASLP
jgi:hypothetical protein